MGNQSSDTLGPRLRRAWIERRAATAGTIRRGEICTVLGVSMAQASADILALLKEHPDCLRYDLNAKLYRWVGCRIVTVLPHPVTAMSVELHPA